MVSAEVMDLLLMNTAMVTMGVTIGLSIWLIDRSRRESPFFYLGESMAKAWAAQTASSLDTGEVAGLPVSPKELQKLARNLAKRRKDMTPEQLAEQDVLNQEVSRLRAREAELEEKVKHLTEAQREA